VQRALVRCTVCTARSWWWCTLMFTVYCAVVHSAVVQSGDHRRRGPGGDVGNGGNWCTAAPGTKHQALHCTALHCTALHWWPDTGSGEWRFQSLSSADITRTHPGPRTSAVQCSAVQCSEAGPCGYPGPAVGTGGSIRVRKPGAELLIVAGAGETPRRIGTENIIIDFSCLKKTGHR
jgi:hypothetical protein